MLTRSGFPYCVRAKYDRTPPTIVWAWSEEEALAAAPGGDVARRMTGGGYGWAEIPSGIKTQRREHVAKVIYRRENPTWIDKLRSLAWRFMLG